MPKGGNDKERGQGRNKGDVDDPPIVIEPDEEDPPVISDPVVDDPLPEPSDNDPPLVTYEAPLVVPEGTVPYYVEGMLYPEEWRRMNWPDDVGSGMVVTYTFLETLPDYYGTDHPLAEGFRAFSEQQAQVTRDALAVIQNVTNLTFEETTDADQAGITFGLADLPGPIGFAYKPAGDGVGNTGSDVWVDASHAGDTFILGEAAYSTLLHELGHAIGLSHPTLPVDEETQQFTVMDKLPHPTMPGAPINYMLYDIAAMQYLYGANMSYAAGNDVYDFARLADSLEVIWDAGGHDVIDMSEATYAVDVNLAGGAFSTVSSIGSNNIAIAFGAVIEDAVGGAFDDTLIGNEAVNRLTGGGGDDILLGGGGDDTLDGGAGNDILVGGEGADTFVFNDTNDGIDTVTDFMAGVDVIDISGVTGSVTYEQRGDNAALLVDDSDFAVFLNTDIGDLI